jgi:hypothetical protein
MSWCLVLHVLLPSCAMAWRGPAQEETQPSASRRPVSTSDPQRDVIRTRTDAKQGGCNLCQRCTVQGAECLKALRQGCIALAAWLATWLTRKSDGLPPVLSRKPATPHACGGARGTGDAACSVRVWRSIRVLGCAAAVMEPPLICFPVGPNRHGTPPKCMLGPSKVPGQAACLCLNRRTVME